MKDHRFRITVVLMVLITIGMIFQPAAADPIQGLVTPNVALFRSSSWENWHIDWSMTGTVNVLDHFGNPTDRPVAGDFNKDGVSDRALFRSGEWIIDHNMDGSVNHRSWWGQTGDIPFIGDFNGDGITDRGVFRAGMWIIDYSMDGSVDVRNTFGTSGDIPVTGDFNNDGITDRALFRGSVWNNWIIDYSMDGSVNLEQHYGQAGDFPLIGDFNCDRITDRSVFRAGELIIDHGMDGTVNSRIRCGQTGDIPLMWNLRTVMAPEPVQSISLSPASATNIVGATHTLTASVQEDGGKAVAGKAVTFTITGPNAAISNPVMTDSNGRAQFTYTGNSGGTDIIVASFQDNTQKTVVSNEATHEWQFGQGISLAPASATDTVGTTHTLIASVEDDAGNPVTGKEVTFKIVAGPHGGMTGTAVTGADGTAQFSYTGNKEGTDTIVADFIDNFGRRIYSDEAAKTWIIENPIPLPSEPQDDESGPVFQGSSVAVPEFPSMALPVVTILGLFLIIQAVRKRE